MALQQAVATDSPFPFGKVLDIEHSPAHRITVYRDLVRARVALTVYVDGQPVGTASFAQPPATAAYSARVLANELDALRGSLLQPQTAAVHAALDALDAHNVDEH